MSDVQTQTIFVKSNLLSFNLHYHHCPCPVVVGFVEEKTLDSANLSSSTIAIVKQLMSDFLLNKLGCCPNQGESITMATFSQNVQWNCPQMWWLHYTSSLNFSVVIIIEFIIITIITIIIIMRWSFWDVQGQLWQVLALRATAWPQQPLLINIVIIVILNNRPLS